MTTTKHIARALPALPPRIDPELKPLLTAIKEVLEVQVGHRGEDLDKAVTFRDLTESGIANLGNQNTVGTLIPISDGGEQTPPPEPVTLSASATFTNVLLSWGGGFRHNLVAATEIYRSTSNNLATASHIGSTSSFIYTDTVEPSTTNYYWVRFRSPAGVAGPYNSTAGTSAVTSSINDAIPDATINVAKIANLTVDMAQVTGTLTAAQFAAITISATDISTGFLSADRIDTSLLNVANMFLNGTLNVHNSTGAIAWGKTSGDDFTNTGLYFGRTGGQLRFNMGSSTSYIYFDGTTVQSVGTQSVAVAPAATTQYQSPGTYTRPLIGADVNRTITIKILGGGGGGGGGAGGAAGAGSSTTVRVKTQSGGTRATYTAGGGQGGPAGDWNAIWNTSPYTTWSSYGGPVNDYGGLGQPVSQGGIFVGSGGGTSRRHGSNASGNGAGGGGFGDFFDNIASASGAAGVYATYSVAVASTTDYIEITVGGGGGGGTKNYGQGDYKSGGNGASGAAQINLA
jgi:hypothetical protein